MIEMAHTDVAFNLRNNIHYLSYHALSHTERSLKTLSFSTIRNKKRSQAIHRWKNNLEIEQKGTDMLHVPHLEVSPIFLSFSNYTFSKVVLIFEKKTTYASP